MTRTPPPLDLQAEEVDSGSQAEASQALPVAVSQRVFQPNAEITALSPQVRDISLISLPSQSGLLMTDVQLQAENATLQLQIESLRALPPRTSPPTGLNLQLQVETVALRSRIESLQHGSQPMSLWMAASAAGPQFLTEMAALRSEIELLRTSLALSPPAPPPYVSR
jgi:hypothetical protein